MCGGLGPAVLGEYMDISGTLYHSFFECVCMYVCMYVCMHLIVKRIAFLFLCYDYTSFMFNV